MTYVCECESFHAFARKQHSMQIHKTQTAAVVLQILSEPEFFIAHLHSHAAKMIYK